MKIHQPARKAFQDIPDDQKEAFKRGDLGIEDIMPSELPETTQRELVQLLRGEG